MFLPLFVQIVNKENQKDTLQKTTFTDTLLQLQMNWGETIKKTLRTLISMQPWLSSRSFLKLWRSSIISWEMWNFWSYIYLSFIDVLKNIFHATIHPWKIGSHCAQIDHLIDFHKISKVIYTKYHRHWCTLWHLQWIENT